MTLDSLDPRASTVSVAIDMSFHEAQFYTNRRNDGAVAIYNGLVKVVRRHMDRARGKGEEPHVLSMCRVIS